MSEPAEHSDEARDLRWMEEALREADLAALHGDVPVGCVVVDAGGIELSRDHNRREERADPTAHAELLALRAAAAKLGHWRLERATVYVTLEPCPMCAGALINSRVGRVVYGASDAKAGALHSLFEIGRDTRLNHRFEVRSGVLAEQGATRLKTFFAKLRTHARSTPDSDQGAEATATMEPDACEATEDVGSPSAARCVVRRRIS